MQHNMSPSSSSMKLGTSPASLQNMSYQDQIHYYRSIMRSEALRTHYKELHDTIMSCDTITPNRLIIDSIFKTLCTTHIQSITWETLIMSASLQNTNPDHKKSCTALIRHMLNQSLTQTILTQSTLAILLKERGKIEIVLLLMEQFMSIYSIHDQPTTIPSKRSEELYKIYNIIRTSLATAYSTNNINPNILSEIYDNIKRPDEIQKTQLLFSLDTAIKQFNNDQVTTNILKKLRKILQGDKLRNIQTVDQNNLPPKQLKSQDGESSKVPLKTLRGISQKKYRDKMSQMHAECAEKYPEFYKQLKSTINSLFDNNNMNLPTIIDQTQNTQYNKQYALSYIYREWKKDNSQISSVSGIIDNTLNTLKNRGGYNSQHAIPQILTKLKEIVASSDHTINTTHPATNKKSNLSCMQSTLPLKKRKYPNLSSEAPLDQRPSNSISITRPIEVIEQSTSQDASTK